MSSHDIVGFVDDVLLPQLHAMANNGAGYLAFGQIGIEFFGACRDSKDFATAGESKARFNKGISHYMTKVDAPYATYNTKKSPYNLYRHLRCGMPI